MPPNISHSFSTSNFRHFSGEDLVNHLHEKIPESYNILEHKALSIPPCVKQVSKTSTTYRDQYCRLRCMPKPQELCLPFTAMRFSGDKLTGISIYKTDYRPFTNKDREKYKGHPVVQRHSLICPDKKFEGKSETKLSFKNPELKSMLKERTAGGIRRLDGKHYPFAMSTTYSSEMKRPRVYSKACGYIPKPNITSSKEPFRHISQYMKEFKVPKVKRDIFEWSFKIPPYCPPTVPMDNITTYKSEFTLKKPVPKPPPRRIPDRRCKECAKSSERTDWSGYFSNFGDGDKTREKKTLTTGCQCCCRCGKNDENRSPCSDKIYDDKRDSTSSKETKGLRTAFIMNESPASIRKQTRK